MRLGNLNSKFLFYSFLSLFIHIAVVADAQNYVDLANLYVSNTPLNQFDSSSSSTRVREMGIGLTYPKKFANGNALIVGLDVESMFTKLTPEGSTGRVGSVMGKFGFNQVLGTKWSGTYIFLPKLASDFYGSLNSKDVQFGALLVFKYIKHSDFKYKLGLYANSELFGPFFVPILGVYYKSPNQKFELDLSLPINGDANYRITPKFFAGARFLAIVKTYNLNKPYYQDKGEYLAKTTNELFGYVGYEISKGILLRGQVGYTFGRNFRLYDTEDKIAWGLSAAKFGDNRQKLNSDFKNGMVFKIDLIYRFYTK